MFRTDISITNEYSLFISIHQFKNPIYICDRNHFTSMPILSVWIIILLSAISTNYILSVVHQRTIITITTINIRVPCIIDQYSSATYFHYNKSTFDIPNNIQFSLRTWPRLYSKTRVFFLNIAVHYIHCTNRTMEENSLTALMKLLFMRYISYRVVVFMACMSINLSCQVVFFIEDTYKWVIFHWNADKWIIYFWWAYDSKLLMMTESFIDSIA